MLAVRPTESRKRFVFIDALRGIAAIAVMLFHLDANQLLQTLLTSIPVLFATVIRQGFLGVQIFFVLSGFVVAHTAATDDVNLRYVGRFMLRRSIRLDPTYWAAIVLE